MARTSSITFGQVAQIADAMKAAGNRPTARAVRERIGSGSMGTIHKFLQQWQGNGSAEEIEAPELPESIASALMDFVSTEIATACEPLNGLLRHAKEDAAEIALDNERLNRANEQMNADIDNLMRELATAKGQLMTIKDEFAEVKTERDGLRTTVNEQARDIDRLERQRDMFAALPLEISELKQSHNELIRKYADLNTNHAVLETRLDAATDHRRDLAERLANTEKRNATQEAELKAAQATAQRSTAELGSIARELAELKTAAQPMKAVKSSAKKTTASKPANQELAV